VPFQPSRNRQNGIKIKAILDTRCLPARPPKDGVAHPPPYCALRKLTDDRVQPANEYLCRCHSHALLTMSSSFEYSGVHPSSLPIFSELAIRTAGSPGRRGTSTTGIGWPVTRRADSITSRTVKPTPLP